MRRLFSTTSVGPPSSSLQVTPSLDVVPPQHSSINAASRPKRRGSASMLMSAAASVSPSLEDLMKTKGVVKGLSSRLRSTTFMLPPSPPTGHVRRASSDASMTIEFQRQLYALFGVCDGDDDGSINQSELVVLFELLGMSVADAQQMVAKNGAESNALVPYTALMRTYRHQIATCAKMNPFPRSDFIMRCKRLKHGLRKADSNGDTVITKAELEIALQKLDFVVSDLDLDSVFAVLDQNGDGSIDWCEFVHAAWHNTLGSVAATMAEPFSIEMLADLPHLFRPVTRSGSARIPRRLSLTRGSGSNSTPNLTGPRRVSLTDRRSAIAKTITNATVSLQRRHSSDASSAIERLGVEYMTRISKERLSVIKKAAESVGRQGPSRGLVSAQVSPSSPTLQRRQTMRTGFVPTVRRQITMIEATAVLIAAAIGLVCGLMTTMFESVIASFVDDAHIVYYVYVVLMNIAVSIVEVHGLYATAILSALRLTVCTNLKLYPQDAEREFLIKSIARAALQVSIRKDKIFGIDPMKGSPRAVLWLTFLMFKSKRYVLKSLLKLLIKRVIWRAAANSVLNLMVIPVNAVMDAWTLRRVMLNCRVNIIGPPCVVTLFEAFFLHDEDRSPSQRVDCVRVIGCVIATKRCVHPNVEIMIEHLRHQWLQQDRWPKADACVCMGMSNEPCPSHVLDDVELLITSLSSYASQLRESGGQAIREHLHNMYFLLVVTLIIDGGVDRLDRRLYNRLCQAGHIQNAWKGVLRLKEDFITGKGIHVNEVYALVQEIPTDTEEDDLQAWKRVPWRESLQYTVDRVAQYLVW